MVKKILILAFLLFLFCFPVLALSSSESTTEESWLLSHTTVNNENKSWDVAQGLVSPAPAKAYAAASDNGLFRIRTNYGREYTADKYRIVTITPDANGWNFVSDNNITVTRPYTFDIYAIKWTRSDYDKDPTASGDPAAVTPSTNDSSKVEFTMTKATWSSSGFLSIKYYSSTFYDYEIVLRLPDLTEAQLADLEPGTYHATFNVTFYTGSDGGQSTTESFTIKGEYGASSSTGSDYSFMIDSVSETYNVDLEQTGTWFDVAKLQFQAMGLSTNSTTRQSTIESQYSGKYQILISPYSNYENDTTSSENPYYFVLNGTENLVRTEINTVYYTLAKSASGSSLSLYNSSRYAHTYVLTPSLSVSGSARNWVLSWEMTQDIYLQPVAASNSTITRAAGFYKTTLYFFVVTN